MSDIDPLISEAGLSFMGRKSLKRAAKRRKGPLKVAVRRAKRKTASLKTLVSRTQRRARRSVEKKFLHGVSKSKLSAAGKSRVERQTSAREGQLKQLRKRLLPDVRKADRKH